nr:immunoglobulin light chain junction region [Macaca mulatta]
DYYCMILHNNGWLF